MRALSRRKGADVIKVEEPGAGDASRKMYDAATVPGGDSSVYLPTNRNKRSVTVDLTTTEGRAVFLRLVERADVVPEAYRGGVAERLGIGYDACAALNPRLIYYSLSVFGLVGPDDRTLWYRRRARGLHPRGE